MIDDSLAAQVAAYLLEHAGDDVADQAREAAARAAEMAEVAAVSPQQAQNAAWIAALGLTIPPAERVAVAEGAGIVLMPSDCEFPDVAAARLSPHLAQKELGVDDPLLLDAARYVPTLRYGATELDKIVFLAWRGAPVRVPSLEEAVFDTLSRLLEEYRDAGTPIHPDLAAAWTDAAQTLGRLPPAWLALEKSVKWDNQGLLTAVVQDADTHAVLTVAYMNREALRLCLATGETHFWSRSRREIWHKGRTSGHTQCIAAMSLDCDRDAVLVKVHPHGPACHTGATSCFFTPVALDAIPFEN
ncbi:MAG: phosphoribosyl-AMP cyclohydrolase [Anaerolineae bacterium]